MMNSWLLFVITSLLGVSAVSSRCSDREDNLILQKLMERYDKAILPAVNGVKVTVELHIQEISSISELSSDFEVDVLFSSIWHDPGLSFGRLGACHRNLTLDLGWQGKIWNPNTCIINSKSAAIHKSPASNIMLILYQNGTVWQNFRMRVKGPCDIDLRRFPFDIQRCSLTIESYSYNSQKVRLKWYEPALTLMKEMDLPDFQLDSWSTEKLTTIYPNGGWDELVVTFTFRREYGFFILQAFIPTFMTVCVAYISFFMDTAQVSARATLGISSFLAMTLQFGNILKNQPRVSYIKALDIWMIAGILFMFATLAELAVISYMQRGAGTIQLEQSPNDPPPLGSAAAGSRLAVVNEDPLEAGGDWPSGARDSRRETRASPSLWSLSPMTVDAFCRAAFPVLFLGFNCGYWLFFLGPWK